MKDSNSLAYYNISKGGVSTLVHSEIGRLFALFYIGHICHFISANVILMYYNVILIHCFVSEKEFSIYNLEKEVKLMGKK